MKITYKGDYALKAILDLSGFYGTDRVIPLIEISQRQDIPEKYLEQIMLMLKRAGFVESKRGIGGGFQLVKPPKEITLGDVVRVIEGPIEPISCVDHNQDSCCGEEAHCAFREVWQKVADSISSIVDQVTFEDLMKRSRELKDHCSGYDFQI